MPTTHTRRYRGVVNSTSAQEKPLLMMEIAHPDLAEPIRVVNDTDDFPYGQTHEWQAAKSVLAGAIAIPAELADGTPAYSGRYYLCTTPGTTGATEPAWPSTIGASVTDGTAVWQCAGNQFKALAFRCRKPDDFEKQLPRAELAVDNVGRELVGWLEASGGGKGATCRMIEALRSAPDVIEWEVTMDLSNLKITTPEVLGTLGFEDMLNQIAVPFTYRPDNSPGIF
ncbi:MAG: DUF1833 domain-containing protein [Betaproteobacteria bacterium]|nr:DUF1833 domain-containing protein [Betaproteobacteria bacterium]